MEQFALAILVGISVVFGYLVALRSNRAGARTMSPGQESVEAERFMAQDLQFQEELSSLKEDNALLRVTKSSIEAELSEAKKRAEDQAAEREMRMAVLKGELEQMRREREHLKTEQARVETENHQSALRITEIARDLTDSHAEAVRLRIAVAEAEARLEEGRRLVRDEVQEMLDRAPVTPPAVEATLRMEYELAQEEVTRLRTLLAEADLERERLTGEVSKVETERDAARGQIAQLEKSLGEAKTGQADGESLAAELRTEREEAARLRALIEDAIQVERNAASLAVELEKTRVERDSYRQEASRLRALLAISNAGQNRQNATAAEVEKLRSELAAVQARAEEAAVDRKRLSEAKQEISKLEEEVETLESQNSHLHASMAEAAARVAEARRLANARTADVAALQHQLDELRQQAGAAATAAA